MPLTPPVVVFSTSFTAFVSEREVWDLVRSGSQSSRETPSQSSGL